MKKNIYLGLVIIFIVVSLGFFYGGMKYGQSKKITPGNLKNLSAEQRQQMMANNEGNFLGMGQNKNGRQNQNNFLNGEIINKDEKSLTLKLPDGGSKIIFFSETTKFMKMATGTMTELKVGDSIMANGSSNTDGSLTAQSIQLRPQDMPAGNVPAQTTEQAPTVK